MLAGSLPLHWVTQANSRVRPSGVRSSGVETSLQEISVSAPAVHRRMPERIWFWVTRAVPCGERS